MDPNPKDDIVTLHATLHATARAFPDRPWLRFEDAAFSYAEASALSLSLVLLMLVLVVVQWQLLGKREFVTITGKGYRPAVWPLGRWRYVCLAAFLLYAL